MLLLCCLISGAGKLLAQNELFGLTYLQNYTNTDYGADPQNWAIVQVPNGIIYVGNADGILEYDGSQWQIIEIAKKSRVRSLASTDQGWVYVGAAGEIGYIRPDESGAMKYHSLIPFLPQKLQNLGEVWKTYVVGKQVFFQVEEKIISIEIHSDHPKIRYIEPQTSFHSSFSVDGTFYVRQRKKGLQKWTGDSLMLVPDGEKFAHKGISEIVRMNDRYHLVTTRIDGLYLYDGKKFTPFAEPLRDFFIEHQVYDAERLPNGQIALATLDFGIVVIDTTGKLVKIINKSNGLNDNNVWYLFSDREHNLWACLESGLARIDVTSPYTLFNETTGIIGDAVSVIYHKKTLYIGTSQGVFYQSSDNGKIPMQSMKINPHTFVQVEGIYNRCYSFRQIGDELIIANSDGIYGIHNKKAVNLYRGYAFSICRLSAYPNKLLVGSDNGVEILDISRRPFVSEGKIENLSNEIREIVEDAQGRIWLTTSFNGIVRLTFSNTNLLKPVIAHLGTETGLPSLDQVYSLLLHGRVVFGTPHGIFEFDDTKNRFVLSPIFPELLKNHSVTFLTSDAKNNVWISGFKPGQNLSRINRSRRTMPFVAKLVPNEEGKYKVNFLNLSGINTLQINSLIVPNDSVVYFGMPIGLTRYMVKNKRAEDTPFQVMLRQFWVGDSVMDQGPKRWTSAFPVSEEFFFEKNVTASGKLVIRVVFGATTFQNPNETRYQVWLENYESDWNAWQKENFKDYIGLPSGTYRFHIRAMNVNGKLSNEVIYTFYLARPWYLRWWMMTVYGLAGLGLIFGIYRFAEYRAKKEKRILEEKVAQRTVEVMEQKEALERQNQAITDSIQYAKRIQQAILPEDEYISSALPKSFIYYRPREIVSGDFYWFLKKEDCIVVAVVDCTGHGVPGAFMSVLGNSLLDQIINDSNIFEPEEILNRLNLAVITSLKQKTDHSDLFDGMDIALLTFYPKAKKVVFGGANRSLIRVRKGILEEAKGDRFSIGGRQQTDTTTRTFSQKEFDLQEGDRFYLYTDGIPDQFGGMNKQKFFNKRVTELIKQIQEHPITEQEFDIDHALTEWRGSYRQTDDMLMIGVEWSKD